jgi:hypothetical protein
MQGLVGRIWAKNPKPSVHGWVLAMQHEIVGWGNDRRLLVQVDGMEKMGKLHIRQCEASRQSLGQKPKTKCSWLGFGHAA